MADKKVLRRLAGEYSRISQQDRFKNNRNLHRAVNDLKPIRPVVLIDELPWNEMNIDNELTIECTDPFLKQIEWFLRTTIYKATHFPADMIISPYIPVNKVILSSGIGVAVDETTVVTDNQNHIVSHEYHDRLATEEDLEKLHNPVISYDKDETMKRFQLVGDMVGDILPVRLKGREFADTGTWDAIAQLRGVTNLLLDLAMRPEFMHQTARIIHDVNWNSMQQYEALGLFDNDPHSLHCTALLTSDLPGRDFDGDHIKLSDVWGRAVAQIFASVSPEMHEEFDIEYIKPAMQQCGLVYYGCCEPLDKKMHIVEKIPNLRKVSITPWADVNIAAETIGKKYVLASKPNPASVAVDKLDGEALRKEIGTILDACTKNGCSCDIVLKDISTCCGRPENIFAWEQIVMEMIT
jgi:hypothetical protein